MNLATVVPFRTRLSRRPWILPASILVLLAAVSLLDRRPQAARFQPPVSEASLEVLGAIEPDPAQPVRSVIRFQWNSLPGADRYELLLFSLDMHEVGRHPAGRQNSLVLDLQETWEPVAPARALLWRVVALAGNKEIGGSSVQTLRLP
jgi:hypothetical protein